jgi:ABC-type glycerol-3-phosphate transport system substrate-binding protein
MNITRRRFLQASTLAATSGLWTTERAGRAAPRAAQSGTLTTWGFTGGGVTEGMQSQVEAFTQKHPDVTVDVQTFPYADVHTNLLNAIISGTGAPDLCSIDVFYLTQYLDGLVDLSAHRAEFEDQFVPPTLDLGSYQGKFYGLAGDSEPVGIFYRQDLWDQYGIKEEDLKTWADLAEAGNKVNTDSKGEVSLYAMFSNDHFLYESLANQQGFGGYYFDDTDTKVIVDDPKMVEAVGVLKQLWEGKGALQNPGGTDIYGDEMAVLLKSGKVTAQLVGAGWYPSTLTQNMPELSGKWRLMRQPVIKEGDTYTGYQYPTILVMPSQSQNQDLAWEFAVAAMTEDGARAMYDKFQILPAWAPLLTELSDTPVDFFGGQKIFQISDEISRAAPKVFFGTGFQEAQQIIGAHLADILSGAKSAEDGLHEAAEEMRQKLNKS